jgi:conjugal transfer pilus assembly protein TraF
VNWTSPSHWTAAAAVAFALLGSTALRAAPSDAPASSSSQSTFWDDSRRGWHFYEDPPVDLPAPPPARPTLERPAPQPTAKRAPELAEFERLQKQVEEFRNIAIMNPTEANVRRYMELESRVVARASLFADVAQRVAWVTPDLDPTLQGRPVNAKALEVFDENQSQTRAKSVADLGRDHVLFFFFRSDCPYCHAFSPTLASFEARYGIRVVPISVDGGGLPAFPEYRNDNGIAKTLQVSQVPALFLAEPFTGKITPIGFGVLSESQLLERITTVSSPGADEVVPSANRQVSPGTFGVR